MDLRYLVQEEAHEMTPEDIADAIVEHTQNMPHVAALSDMCGGMVYPLALEFARHLPEEEGHLLADIWDHHGPQRVSFLFSVWCAHELSEEAITPDGLDEPSYF